MKMIVGLGNPGKEYDGTRHNYGFAALDALAKKYNVKFSNEKKFKGQLAELFIDGQKVILLKPSTYMNKSGESVAETMAYFNISTDRIWIVYDDIDLDLGDVRIRTKGSSGGHKGVQSVIDSVGTEEIARFRLGIKSKDCDFLSTEDIVLQKFGKDEQILVDKTLNKVVSEIERALAEGIEHASV